MNAQYDRRRFLLIGIAAAVALAATATSVSAQPARRRARQQLRRIRRRAIRRYRQRGGLPIDARDAVRRGDVRPLRDVVALVRRRSNAEVLDVDLYRRPQGWVYAMRVLTAQGRVRDSKQHFDHAARMDPMNDGVTDAARHSRYQNHWLMWPLRLIQRVGRIQIWLGFIVLYFGLRALGQTQLLGIIAISYLVLVIYSWVVPPLLRRWLQRSQGNRFSR